MLSIDPRDERMFPKITAAEIERSAAVRGRRNRSRHIVLKSGGVQVRRRDPLGHLAPTVEEGLGDFVTKLGSSRAGRRSSTSTQLKTSRHCLSAGETVERDGLRSPSWGDRIMRALILRRLALRGWLHEIKHDDFRVIARKDGKRVKLYSRPAGNDLPRRFTPIVEAVARLKARTCIIDGEAVACGPDGIACFDLIRQWGNDERVFLLAFDLIELNGDDLRREPLLSRTAMLEIALAGAAPASSSTSTSSTKTAGSCSAKLAGWALRGSSPIERTHTTPLAARHTGSS